MEGSSPTNRPGTADQYCTRLVVCGMDRGANLMVTPMSAERLTEYADAREHRGPLPEATASVSHRHPACGDVVELAARVEAGVLQVLRFEARGCVVSRAAAAMLCEALEGEPVGRLSAFSTSDMLALVGLPLSARRIACALVPLEAAHILAAKLPPTTPAPPGQTTADPPSSATPT